MDENPIFKPVNAVQSEAGVPPEAPAENPINFPPPPELPSAPPPSKLFGFLKILLGIVIVVGFFALIYNTVLPKFFPDKINQVKLTYWGLLEDASIVAPIIADFEKLHPNIAITYSKENLEQYRDRLTTRANNGNGPDVFEFHNTWVPELSGLLLPLPSNVLSKDDLSKNYYPVVKTDLVKNGAIYGVPLEIDTLNLFINRDLLQAAGLKAPTTWIDFMNFARQLTVKDDQGNIKTAGAAMGTFANITHAPDILSMLLVQNGVNLNDMASNLPAVGDALSFYTSFAASQGNVWDDTLDESVKTFASGSLAMYFGYSGDFFTIKALNPNLAFDIYSVPSLPGQDMTIASYWVGGVSGKSKHQKEALLFLQYLTSKETAQKLFAQEAKVRNFGEPYARIDLASSLSNSIVYPFVSSAPSAVSSYFIGGTNDNGINSKMNSDLNVAVDSVLKGESPSTAAETLSKGVSQTLNQYGQ